jgi:hypothetical protein
MGECEQTMKDRANSVTSAAFSPNSLKTMSAGGDPWDDDGGNSVRI